MGAIVLIVGIIGIGAVIAAVVTFVVTRKRSNPGNGGPINGTSSQNMGYPPQQAPYPTAQQPYPTPAPNQGHGHPAPPAQPPQHPNPYTQQPPGQGQL
jgi:hypothetical protein